MNLENIITLWRARKLIYEHKMMEKVTKFIHQVVDTNVL